tara:strand:+ start:948 stop:1601 length:654 start_codon:yes stop_codon:yes gene_type:complete
MKKISILILFLVGVTSLCYGYDESYKGSIIPLCETIEIESRVYISQDMVESIFGVRLEKNEDMYRIFNFNKDQENKFLGELNQDGTRREGQLFYTNGDMYEGSFNHNIPEDRDGVMLFANGNFYRGEFKEGYMHGKGTLKFNNGNMYTGDFKYGVIFGTGRMKFNDGAYYNGHFKMGLFHGAGYYRTEKGGLKQGLWEYGDYIRYMTDTEIEKYTLD